MKEMTLFVSRKIIYIVEEGNVIRESRLFFSLNWLNSFKTRGRLNSAEITNIVPM